MDYINISEPLFQHLWSFANQDFKPVKNVSRETLKHEFLAFTQIGCCSAAGGNEV
jgi:hypothetical protein